MHDEKYYEAIKEGIKEAFLEALRPITDLTEKLITEKFMKAVQDGIYDAAYGLFADMRPLNPKEFLFEAIKEAVENSIPN